MNNDESLLIKRLIELAEKADRQGICTCTGFLSMAEQSDFFKLSPQLNYINYKLFGGTPECERQMVMFGERAQTERFPIDCLLIEPLNAKFADELSHRDFLGALMNLGVKRTTLGDIFVSSNSAYLFCIETISDYIIENLTRVRHTSVRCIKCRDFETEMAPKYTQMSINTASERLDAVLAAVFKLSRDQSADLITKCRAFINGRLITDASRSLKCGDIVTARGFGRFIYDGVTGNTKKGRNRITVRLYK